MFKIRSNKVTKTTTEINKKETEKMTFETAKKNLIEKAKDSRYLPEYGAFTPICEKYENQDRDLYIGNIEIQIIPSRLLKKRPERRTIALKAESPSGLSTIEQDIMYGNREEIIKMLQQDDFDNLVQEKVRKFSYDFIENRSV